MQTSDVNPKAAHIIQFPNYQIYWQLFDTLARYDRKLDPQPELAESWEWGPNKESLTFKLRRGVKFHSGKVLTAKDVQANIERVQKPETASQMRAFALDVKEMQTPDDQTLVLKLAGPRPAIFDMFEALYILDPDHFDAAEKNKPLIGTGPFSWDTWVPGDHLSLKRFDGYWKEGFPYLDRIETRVVKDVQAGTLNLEAGAADVVTNPPANDLVRLKANDKFRVLTAMGDAQYYYLGANVTDPILKDKRVRQGINYAIDRKRFVDIVLFGLGEATCIPWPKNSPAYDESLARKYEFNLDKAKALFQEAGLTKDKTIQLTVNAGAAELGKLAEIVQADLAKIDVTMKIEQRETALFQTAFSNRAFPQMWGNIFGFNNMHPSTLMIQAFPWRVKDNVSYFESEEYTSLAKQAQVEPDPAKAKELFKKLTEYVLDQSFMYPVSPQRNSWAMGAYVQGGQDTTFNMISFRDVWLNK